MQIEIESCSYVKFSDVFAGMQEAIAAFAESDPNFSWGENDKTLISIKRIMAFVAEMVEDYVVGSFEKKELEEVLSRLESLPTFLYVDLEN